MKNKFIFFGFALSSILIFTNFYFAASSFFIEKINSEKNIDSFEFYNHRLDSLNKLQPKDSLTIITVNAYKVETSKSIKRISHVITNVIHEAPNKIQNSSTNVIVVKEVKRDTLLKPVINSKDTTPKVYVIPKSNSLDFTKKIDTIESNGNAMHIKIQGHDIFFILVDLKKSDVAMHLYQGGKNAGVNYYTIDALLNSNEVSKKDKVEMITNGGMYLNNGKPQGLYIENKQLICKLDTANPKNGTNFYLMPNGVFFIKNNNASILSTDSFKKSELLFLDSISYATQSGPMLVKDGKINSAFSEGSNNEKLRSAVGVISNELVVFAICDNINFWNFSVFFKNYLKCKNALYLDGVVSRMYINKLSRKEHDGTFGAMICVTSK